MVKRHDVEPSDTEIDQFTERFPAALLSDSERCLGKQYNFESEKLAIAALERVLSADEFPRLENNEIRLPILCAGTASIQWTQDSGWSLLVSDQHFSQLPNDARRRARKIILNSNITKLADTETPLPKQKDER
jgi:hypothetical protein